MPRARIARLALALVCASCGDRNPSSDSDANGSATEGGIDDDTTAAPPTDTSGTTTSAPPSTTATTSDTSGSSSESDDTGIASSDDSTTDTGPPPGTFFESDFETQALDEIFADVNAYGDVIVELSTDVAHSGR